MMVISLSPSSQLPPHTYISALVRNTSEVTLLCLRKTLGQRQAQAVVAVGSPRGEDPWFPISYSTFKPKEKTKSIDAAL